MSPPPPTDLKSKQAASYDILAPTYNKWTLQNPSPRLHWISKLLSHLPSSSPSTSTPILELGAGAGLPTTKALLEHAPNVKVLANEFSRVQLDLARANLASYAAKPGRVEFLEGDMCDLVFGACSLAGVVGMYSVIHVPREEQRVLLCKIAGWLVPGGMFLANFSQEESAGSVVEDWLGVKEAWMFWSGWGVEGSVGMIEGAGLEILEKEVVADVVDADFLWVLARKPLE